MKISFLAQRVYACEILRHFLRHFSQIYPTHSRLVYDPTGTILAILYGEVLSMLPAKYQPKPHGGSGEEDFEGFIPYMGMAAILNFGSKPFLAIFRSLSFP